MPWATAPGPSVKGRFLVIVATPELFGSCDGSRSAGSGTTDDERKQFARSEAALSGSDQHAKREISPRYLSEDERVRIADLERQGLGVRAIAAGLGRSPATISRELRRNRDPDSGQYRPFTAQRLAVGGLGPRRRDPLPCRTLSLPNRPSSHRTSSRSSIRPR